MNIAWRYVVAIWWSKITWNRTVGWYGSSTTSFQVTPKTLADVKGGTLISYEGRVQVNFSASLRYQTNDFSFYDFQSAM
jgi:hypothetical protein